MISARDRGAVVQPSYQPSLQPAAGNSEKYSEEEYSNYVDSSDVVISSYKNSSTIGHEKYFLQIEEWIDRRTDPLENTPYIVEADEGVGKKSLLVKWIEYH